jgi:hypothetical protein
MALTKVTSPMMKGQTLTYQIPTDFSSLQDAVDALSPTVNNDNITLNIETGHKLTSGLIVENGDYTQFTVTSSDSTVTLVSSWAPGTALLTGTNARMPNWNIFVNCEGKNVNAAVDTGAINVLENSELLLGDGAGCTNGAAGNNGIFVYRNSKVTGNVCVFTNFPGNNVWITHASSGYMERVTATGAGVYGMFVSRSSVGYASGGDFSNAGTYGVIVLRSRVTAIPAVGITTKFNDCGTAGVFADTCASVSMATRDGLIPQFYNSPTGVRATYGATVDVRGSDFQGCNVGVRVTSATVLATNCTFSDVVFDCVSADDGGFVDATNMQKTGSVGRNAIRAINGARVTANNANIDDCGSDTVFCEAGALVDVTGCTATGSGLNAFYASGGEIVAISCTATGAASRGAFALNGGRINVSGSNLSGGVVGGLRAVAGSNIAANNCNAQSGGSPATSDCQIQTGSIITFTGGTGGTNATINTLLSSGIIFG